jgi:hypothetical protein
MSSADAGQERKVLYQTRSVSQEWVMQNFDEIRDTLTISKDHELPAPVASREAGDRRRRLRSGLSIAGCVLLIGSFCVAQSAPVPAPFSIHDFTPDFWRFWEAAQNQPMEKQAQLWQDLYVSRHQEVFNDLATPCKDQWNPAWSRSHYLPDLPKLVPGIRTLVADLPRQLDEANSRFLEAFPDMHWAGDIYVMASAYCFTGRSQVIQGRGALLFGVDGIAGFGQKDLIPGMHHELFHRYHRDFFDFEASSNYPLWTALWAEGMATYVSEMLNPSASEIDLAQVPLGMVRQVNDRRARLAADFLRRFESTAEKDAKLYFNDINSRNALVPPRAGYQLGVLVIRDLSKKHSIQAMAHWSQSEAKPNILAALKRISAIP